MPRLLWADFASRLVTMIEQQVNSPMRQAAWIRHATGMASAYLAHSEQTIAEHSSGMGDNPFQLENGRG
jgi:ribosomal protein S12